MGEITRLTKAEIQAVETETALLTGEPPALDTLIAEGYRETVWLNAALDWIGSAGRVVTLLVAEFILAGAALAIAAVFGVLEYWRVHNGALALGQPAEQAALIAVAVVTANIVHPIYSLRQLRGQKHLHVLKMTLRGFLAAFWRRLTGQPTIETVDLYHNPTLHLAAGVITWSTIILAVYDILGPLLSEVFTGKLSRPLGIALMELLMGLGLSIAGVFFLQSAAHEIGVRTLTDQPERLTDVLERRRAEHAALVERTRDEVRARHMAAKAADQQRRALEAAARPFGNSAHEPAEVVSMPMSGRANGHGGASTLEN